MSIILDECQGLRMGGETMDLNGGAHLQRYPDLLGLVTKAFA